MSNVGSTQIDSPGAGGIYAPMAVESAGDWYVQQARNENCYPGVGGTIVASGTAGKIDMSAGIVVINGVEVFVAAVTAFATTITTLASALTSGQAVWVGCEIDLTGTLNFNAGTAAQSDSTHSPVKPTPSSDRCVVAWLFVPFGATAVDALNTNSNTKAKILLAGQTTPGPGPAGWQYEQLSPVSLSSTVAAGSNGVATSSFAGAGTLNVAAVPAGTPTTGVINVVHSGTTSQIYYTGITSTTYTGCLLVGTTVTMSTGDVVRLNGFQISSATDLSARYQKGTRVRWRESATTKWAAVVGVTFGSSLTTFTFGASSDATSTVAASPDANAFSFSNEPCPRGYPDWFNFTTVPTGYSAAPNQNYRFRVLGRTVSINGREIADGTSSATTKTYTTPGIPASTAMNTQGGFAAIKNNSAAVGTGALVGIATGALVWTVYADFVFGLVTAWTASGSARVYVSRLDYEF